MINRATTEGATSTVVLTPAELQAASIIAWIEDNTIKNEKGDPISFQDHPFLYDIYRDQADELVVVKCAQCGLSTCEILRNHHAAKHQKMDIIYTLPTDGDVSVFVGGKVNRIISNNPSMLADVKDKDSIEQKAVGPSMIYFRGTWTKKAAIMITADRLSHDEKDSSKQDVVEDYKRRLDSPTSLKQRHVFSHPSLQDVGVDIEWKQSDQKEWFIDCPHCHRSQYLTWDVKVKIRMSVDIEREEYVCKKCSGILSDDDRRRGHWVARYPGRKISGYHISQMMSPRIPASEICAKWREVSNGLQTEEHFHNKVLGLPYAASKNKVTAETILTACTDDRIGMGRVVIGVDTGLKLRYVIGDRNGLFGFGEFDEYEPREATADRPAVVLEDSLEILLVRNPGSIMVIDQGGDIKGSRSLQKKYPGRVFLCHYRRDRKTQRLVDWPEKDGYGTVIVDRNRYITMVSERFGSGQFSLHGSRETWAPYAAHWSHIYRTQEENNLGVVEYVWKRTNRDDWVHATVYQDVGSARFGGIGAIDLPTGPSEKNSYMFDPDGTVTFNPDNMFHLPNPDQAEDDWR